MVADRTVFRFADLRKGHRLNLVQIVERHLPIGAVAAPAPKLFIDATMGKRLCPNRAQRAIAVSGIVKNGDCIEDHSCDVRAIAQSVRGWL